MKTVPPISTVLAEPAINNRIAVDGRFFARGGERLRVQGVTYGPFAPDREQPFPSPEPVEDDFCRMRAAGINSIRTYHLPPERFLEAAGQAGMSVLVDVPWPKHICFLDSVSAQRQARQAVREAAARAARHESVWAMSVGNEISADIVSWHGATRVEKFIAELMDEAKQAHPTGLVTYANFPSTEYLDLSFLDFNTFNVYLDDAEVFRRYLYRLQNLVGDKPLLLGEIGMDTFRHGEEDQAQFLASHLYESTMMGVAGAYVFSWTDDWHTGGARIEDWAFGITEADRAPKISYHQVREMFGRSPAEMLIDSPFVSVVVCSYNGAETLAQCLDSLRRLNYPNYEVILVDDGSTDNTPEISARYPDVRTIRQENKGLSVARNVGLKEGRGEIIAYTDSDCFVDSDWLSRLVYQLLHTGAAAVGGPNLTPDDGALAACVAASPGQPTHVLDKDQRAEHIPGCNMAFHREALEKVNGFNPKYRKAGDDVDVCWRIQQEGLWITFAPGATVWHHRRQNPRLYLRQQAGYGEAEGLLWFDHPDRFNALGEGKWEGVIYGASFQGLRIGRPVIYHGLWNTALFQTLYQPSPAHWASLPATLEWHLAAALIAALGIFWLPMLAVACAMLGLSVLVALMRGAQASLPAEYKSLRARLIISALSYAQPIVRSFWRYRMRLFPPMTTQPEPPPARRRSLMRRSLRGTARTLYFRRELVVEYWDEKWRERTELLQNASDCLAEGKWTVKTDSGWNEWDLELYGHPWTMVQMRTAQEDHGNGKRLMRCRYRLEISSYARVIAALGLLALVLGAVFHSLITEFAAVLLAAAFAAVWHEGARLASQAIDLVDDVAEEMKLVPCADVRCPDNRRVDKRRADNRADAIDEALAVEMRGVEMKAADVHGEVEALHSPCDENVNLSSRSRLGAISRDVVRWEEVSRDENGTAKPRSASRSAYQRVRAAMRN